MLKSCKTNAAKEKLYGAEKTVSIRDVNVNNIAISYLIETKNNWKHLAAYLDEVIKPSILILPEMSGWVDILKYVKRKIKK